MYVNIYAFCLPGDSRVKMKTKELAWGLCLGLLCLAAFVSETRGDSPKLTIDPDLGKPVFY